MTFHSSPPLAAFPQIRYIDLPRNAVSVRRNGASLRRVAVVTIAAATLLVAAIGFASAAGAAPDATIDRDPVAPAVPWRPSLIPAPGAGVANPVQDQWRPSLIPDQGEVSLAVPKPGSVIFAPKPPGRVPAA